MILITHTFNSKCFYSIWAILKHRMFWHSPKIREELRQAIIFRATMKNDEICLEINTGGNDDI